MRGREIYSLFKPTIRLGQLFLSICPRSLVQLLLVLARPVPTKLGIGLRYLLVSRLAKRCGECVAIHENVYLYQLQNMEFGNHVSIHPMCYLDASGGLKIGSEVSIAHGSSIMTHEHNFQDATSRIRSAPMKCDPVVVEDDVWIGCGVRILAGLRIGTRTVVGAGSVVTRDIPDGVVAVGVPARPLKQTQAYAA